MYVYSVCGQNKISVIKEAQEIEESYLVLVFTSVGGSCMDLPNYQLHSSANLGLVLQDFSDSLNLIAK